MTTHSFFISHWLSRAGFCALALLVLAGAKCSSSNDDGGDHPIAVERIDVVDLTIAQQNTIPFIDPEGFPDGIIPSLGAGLYFRETTDDNQLAFTLLTNRGPTATTPPTLSDRATRLFAVADYNPQWWNILINLNDQGAQTLQSQVRLQSQNQGPVRGTPNDSSAELALDRQLQALPTTTELALNPADLVGDGDGGYWLVDQYGPSLMAINQGGEITRHLLPQGSSDPNGEKILPTILQQRRLDQGFSAVARNQQTGIVYAVMQNVLGIGQQPPFIRLIAFNPQNQTIQQFAYPIADLSTDGQQVVIGAARWLDDQRLLVSIYGQDNDNQPFNYLQIIDLKDATDLTGLTVLADVDGNGVQSLPLEWIGSRDINGNRIAKPDNLRYGQTRVALNLRDYGWIDRQANGLALINASTVAVINNSHYSLQSRLKNPVPEGNEISNYRVDQQNGELYLADNPTNPVATTLVLEPTETNNELWIFYLNQALHSNAN